MVLEARIFPPPGTGGGQEGGFAESAGPLLVWGGPPPDLPLKGEEKSHFLAIIGSPADALATPPNRPLQIPQPSSPGVPRTLFSPVFPGKRAGTAFALS